MRVFPSFYLFTPTSTRIVLPTSSPGMGANQSGTAPKHASDGMSSDDVNERAAITKWGPAIRFASDAVRANRNVVMAAVRKHGCALQFASRELRADKDIVMAAVRQAGVAIKYAPPDLRADEDVVMAAVKQTLAACRYAHGAMWANRDFVQLAVRYRKCRGWYKAGGRHLYLSSKASLLHRASPELQTDPVIVLTAMTLGGCVFSDLPDASRADKRVVQAVYPFIHPHEFGAIPASLRADLNN